jgi:hypothetical protein
MGTRLCLAEWSPEGRVLLFATADGTLQVNLS